MSTSSQAFEGMTSAEVRAMLKRAGLPCLVSWLWKHGEQFIREQIPGRGCKGLSWRYDRNFVESFCGPNRTGRSRTEMLIAANSQSFWAGHLGPDRRGD